MSKDEVLTGKQRERSSQMKKQDSKDINSYNYHTHFLNYPESGYL